MSAVMGRPRLTRDKVIDAAADIASRDGIDGLSMRRLAEELDVSTMATYRHVVSKQALVEALLLRAWAHADRAAEQSSDRVVRLEAAWEACKLFPGIRFELRPFSPQWMAWGDWLAADDDAELADLLVGLLAGQGSIETVRRAARAVAS